MLQPSLQAWSHARHGIRDNGTTFSVNIELALCISLFEFWLRICIAKLLNFVCNQCNILAVKCFEFINFLNLMLKTTPVSPFIYNISCHMYVYTFRTYDDKNRSVLYDSIQYLYPSNPGVRNSQFGYKTCYSQYDCINGMCSFRCVFIDSSISKMFLICVYNQNVIMSTCTHLSL